MPDNRRPGGPGRPGRPAGGPGGPGRLGDPVRATYKTRGKSYELRPSRDMRNAGKAADQDLAGALLKLIAVGVAGGIATIAGAKKVGEEIVSMQEEAAMREEAQREAYREAVREATANDIDFEYETRHEDPEFEVELEVAESILTPTEPEEKAASEELILETTLKAAPEEIRIDDQDAVEEKVAEAMYAYSEAMDEAAGVK